MTWAQRLKRVFKIDIEICEHCGGAVKVAAPAHPARAAFVPPCTAPLLRILRARHSCLHAQHRRSGRDQENPRSSRAARRGRDASVQTLRSGAAATRIAGPEETRLTADPCLTPGREAGLTPGMVSLAPAGLNGEYFAAGNPLSPSCRRRGAMKFRGKRPCTARSFLPTALESYLGRAQRRRKARLNFLSAICNPCAFASLRLCVNSCPPANFIPTLPSRPVSRWRARGGHRPIQKAAMP